MKTDYEIACEVLDGLWGNGTDRIKRLNDAGYNYKDIQAIVNAIANNTYTGDTQINEHHDEQIMEINISLSKYKGITLIFGE